MGALGNLVPLVILFAVLGVFAWVGYQMYVYANELSDRGKRHMEKKNVVFSKDGMKVGVKEVRDEDYADKTQSVLVKAWNMASIPGYKSKWWGNEPTPDFRRPAPSPRTTSSSSASKKRS